jgi:hypothetical protein
LTTMAPIGITSEMAARKRPRLLNVRMLDAETEMLSQLAVRDGVSVSEWVRNTVRTQHAVAFSDSGKRPAKRKR